MRVFTCTDHDGHYPVPVASVVVADDEDTARRALSAKLVTLGLKDETEQPFSLQELDATEPSVIVLCDGEY